MHANKIDLVINGENIDESLKANEKSPIRLALNILIGKNYNSMIGHLLASELVASTSSNNDISSTFIIIISAAICSFLLVIIAIIVLFKVYQKKQAKQLKRMQTEFENLESRVANECKEAFAELQMDIGELANTLNQSGPPFNEFQTYAIKILFPNASEKEKLSMSKHFF